MLLTQTSSRHAGKSNDRGRKTPSRRLVRSCWRATPQSSSSVTFCSFLFSALPRPVVPFCAPLVPSTVPLMACEERCCLTMPPLLTLLSTAAGTNAAQTAIATSRPNAAGDDYDAVDNERQKLTLLTASIRMAGRSRMSGMRGAALWKAGTGHGPPPIPSLTLFVEQVLRGEAQSPPGTARRAQPRGKEVCSSLLWTWAVASGLSAAAVSLWCLALPCICFIAPRHTGTRRRIYLQEEAKIRIGYANLGGQARRDSEVAHLCPAAGSSPLTWS
ncbi:hypothetical protein V8C44DRAFT_314807 [Trichoderma aethiopicum]